MVGPFIAYYQRIEARERPGVSLHTLYGFGGQSARDMGAALLASTDETLRLYFDRVRALQGEQK